MKTTEFIENMIVGVKAGANFNYNLSQSARNGGMLECHHFAKYAAFSEVSEILKASLHDVENDDET